MASSSVFRTFIYLFVEKGVHNNNVFKMDYRKVPILHIYVSNE